MTNREPDFVFNLTVPVHIPSEEEKEMIGPHLDPYLNTLIEKGYLSEEEAIAFVKFASELGAAVPFMMDSFINSYRSNKNNNATRKQLQEDAEAAKNIDSSKLIV